MLRALSVKYVATFWQELGHIRYLNWGIAIGGMVYVVGSETKHRVSILFGERLQFGGM